MIKCLVFEPLSYRCLTKSTNNFPILVRESYKYQGHGRFLVGKTSIVVATTLVCRRSTGVWSSPPPLSPARPRRWVWMGRPAPPTRSSPPCLARLSSNVRVVSEARVSMAPALAHECNALDECVASAPTRKVHNGQAVASVRTATS